MELVQPGGSGSGSPLTVTDGVTTVNNVTTIDFSGATVLDGGGGTADVIISGSGLTTLNSTETPNGVITVFTFPAASAQPTFIVSDNALNRATTKAGTVQWTWNGGAKQATMTIPPTDEIFAIA